MSDSQCSQKGMNNRYTSYDKSDADRSKKVAIFFIYILIKQDYSALIAISPFTSVENEHENVDPH